MIKKHMRRLTMPKTWPIKRKGIKYTTRPNPGKIFNYSLPLNVVLRDLIKIVKTTREAKYIIQEKEILVDGKKRKDIKYPVGLMDIVSLPEEDKHFRMVLTEKGKLGIVEEDKKNISTKIVKIINKSKIKKKTQLNLFDSRNILVDKDSYKIGDSVILKIPKQEIDKVLKFEKNAYVLIVSGKYAGSHGIIEDIGSKNIILTLSDDKKIETRKDYAFVIGKEKPEIALIK